jgi:hypothetical protein
MLDERLLSNNPADSDMLAFATGWVGLAGMKSKSSQWNMYPALRKEVAFVLDFLALQCVSISRDVVAMDEHNRRRGHEDYKSRLPKNRHGRRRKKRMMELAANVKLYRECCDCPCLPHRIAAS